jgi:hypothetical protein
MELRQSSIAPCNPGNCACRVARCLPGGGLFFSPEPSSARLHWGNMPDVEPELLTLLIAERLAFDRLERLRGYPDDIVKVAEDLWWEAAEAVREYRSKHP